MDPVDPGPAPRRIPWPGGAEDQHRHAIAPGIEDRHRGVHQPDVRVQRDAHHAARGLRVAVRHLALSSRMKRANSAGELVTISMPCDASRAFNSGALRIRTTSALTFAMMSEETRAGMNSPSHGSRA